MNMKHFTRKIICAGILSGSLGTFQIRAEEPADAVARLTQELNRVQAELAAAKAREAEKDAQIAELKKGTVTTLPAVAAVDSARLEQELKASKAKINELEEQLFVATDGKGVGGEEVAEVLPEGTYPWTANMRRLPIGVLFPKTATIPKGQVYARFSHVSQHQTFAKGGKGDPFDDFLGLEDGVKIGILFGYGITKNWDVMVQRQNGRAYTGLAPGFEDRSYDLWDVMTKYKFMDEFEQGVDASISGGTTIFWQDNDHMEFAGNAALSVEKSFGRFRAGSGLLYTSLSTYEGASSAQGGTANEKYYVNEETFGAPRPQNHTMAVPVSLSFALTNRQQLFGEMAFPVSGYDTGCGPSMAAGWRYNSPTHAYSIYLSNTANSSFNSAFTGGYKDNKLDLFGFDISIFF